jgi:hypothetical protein
MLVRMRKWKWEFGDLLKSLLHVILTPRYPPASYTSHYYHIVVETS